MGVVINDSHVKVGQSVVVFGVGGVGLNIVQAAAMVSAHPIIGVDLLEHKLEMAKTFGATDVLNSTKTSDTEADILRIVGANGADVVIETTGNARVIELAYRLTQPRGKTILVGVPKKSDNVSIYTLPLHFNKVLKGSEGGSCVPHLDIPKYVRLVHAGKLKLDGIVTHEFRLEEINQAIEKVKSGEAGRVLLAMD
jgi:S-(hydroxymethyl)glutathione dehydrogenase/alcohol dehydrogenase